MCGRCDLVRLAAEAFHALIKEVEKTNGLLDSDHQGLCVIL